MRSSLAIVLVSLLIAATFLSSTTTRVHAMEEPGMMEEPMAEQAPRTRRQKVCHTDTDCLLVITGGQTGQLMIDKLDFKTNTLNDMLEQDAKYMPKWFGARPADFFPCPKCTKPLDKTVPIFDLDLRLGQKVFVRKAVAEVAGDDL